MPWMTQESAMKHPRLKFSLESEMVLSDYFNEAGLQYVVDSTHIAFIKQTLENDLVSAQI